MKMKTSFVWVVLVIACASLLLMSSCAKKQVGVAEAEVRDPIVTPEKDPVTDEAAAELERRRQAELEALRRTQLEIEAFESVNIYFDFDRSEIRPEAQVILQNKARWLKANPDYMVRVEGHCDERGTAEYNLALGERRAKAAADYLVSLGISADRLRTLSFGEERPADPRSNEVAWARNRRAEFKLFR